MAERTFGDEEDAASVRHRVLGRTVVGADGKARRSLHVFCTAQRASQPLERCRTCVDCLGMDAGDEPRWIDCGDRAPHPPVSVDLADPASGAAPDASTALTPVGAVALPRVVCVRADVPVTLVLRLVGPEGLAGLPVVDDEGRLLGALRPAAELAQRGRHELTTALSFMRRADEAVCEDEPLWAAVRSMARGHLRVVPIVTRDGVVSGLLRDVDALRWLARR